ncbi:MAG TPA: acyl-CoA dehydrogenase family protein [Burkholderiales bacterium]|nr:acyl-CoA dehydrogenase family protein [Burkholderiales bacterium]
MYNLHLTPEQLEFRDTIRDFVKSEVHPVAIHSDRLQPFEKPLLLDLLDETSRMGLRALALSENAGGAGADTMTSAIVLEELAAGDVDLAMVLGLTSQLGAALFDEALSTDQRAKFLPAFLDERRGHLALAAHDYDAVRGWHYHRDYDEESGGEPTAVKQSNGDWIVDGEYAYVANAPVASLFALQVRTDPKKTGRNGLSTLLVPRDTPGLTIGEPPKATGEVDAEGVDVIRWQHGTGARVTLKNCRVPAASLVGAEGQTPLCGEAYTARAAIQTAAINLGVGRAAFDAAVDYAKIRVQGGRPIVQHQSIGTILADCATKLELARSLIWKAAWTLDNPDAVADRSVDALPLAVMARTYTAEAMEEVALGAAECFGAMGVMRDMPLQKYVHDTMVFLHSADHDSATKLGLAEAVAGFERKQEAA